MSFLRLSRAHWVAGAAALVLLLAMAMDWYSSVAGEEARRIESITDPPATGFQGDIDREVLEESSTIAEQEEENAWQASGALDRVILVLALASVGLALAAAVLRARSRSDRSPAYPSAVAAVVGAVTALLIVVRIVEVGSSEVGGEVELGAPLALVAVAALAVAAARAARAESDERAQARAPA